MSEEILQAAGDTAFWRRKAEQAEALARTLQTQRDAVEQNAADLRAALAQAEADAAALRALCERQLDPTRTIRDRHMELIAALASDHPGAALLAELEASLLSALTS